MRLIFVMRASATARLTVQFRREEEVSALSWLVRVSWTSTGSTVISVKGAFKGAKWPKKKQKKQETYLL